MSTPYRTDWAAANRQQQRDLHDHFQWLPDLDDTDRLRTERHAYASLLAFVAGHLDPEVLHAAILTAKANAGANAEVLRRQESERPRGRHEAPVWARLYGGAA